MPITAVDRDPNALTLTITADFPVSRQRLWDAYSDPRQLEKFWGPPGWPATFSRHDFTPGGFSHYYMTGPDGDKYCGYWRVLEVDEPERFSFADGFAHEDFTPNTDLPESRNEYGFAPEGDGTRATFVATYATLEGLRQVLDMGMVEGATAALGQIDDLLAA